MAMKSIMGFCNDECECYFSVLVMGGLSCGGTASDAGLSLGKCAGEVMDMESVPSRFEACHLLPIFPHAVLSFPHLQFPHFRCVAAVVHLG